jgi:signal transduction histidine kinase
VRIAVTDTGPGIAESLRTQVFEPFVRGAGHGEPGIGLGLATVSRIVRAHDGQYGVESKQGAGSTFWFTLPEAPAVG